MPAPERGGYQPPEEPRRPEEEPPPYRRAARFPGEHQAGASYFALQRVIYEAQPPVDLSVYRLQLNRLWHVAALGILPPAAVLHAIEEALAPGEPADFPTAVWQALTDRRAQQSQRGPGIEKHHRPGKPL